MPKGKPVTEEFVAQVLEAIGIAGNQTELGKAICKSPACVSSWATGRAKSVTGKSMRQITEYLEAAKTPDELYDEVKVTLTYGSLTAKSVPIHVNEWDKEDEILVPKMGEKFPISETDNQNFAQEVLSEFVKVRARQKGSLLLWQIKLIHRAEQILGLRDERNEPVGQ